MVRVRDKDYMENARGDLVPLDKVRPVDTLRDEAVRSIVSEALSESARLKEFKNRVFKEFDDFCALSLSEYGVKYGGKKGNIALTSYDGKYKVLMSVQDVISFDERLQAAKELIDRCIVKWSDGASDNLKILVNDAFKVDKKGNVDTKRIMELRRYEIEDNDWKAAMDAIAASVTISMSRRYMRIYKRNQEGDGYTMIPLDFAAI